MIKIISLLISMTAAAYADSPLKPGQVTLTILTDLAGRTVYVFDKDLGTGTSTCEDLCATHWPAVPPPSSLQPPLGKIQRKDGTEQLTLNDRPVYYFFKDVKPGDALGDGLGGVWHIIHP